MALALAMALTTLVALALTLTLTQAMAVAMTTLVATGNGHDDGRDDGNDEAKFLAVAVSTAVAVALTMALAMTTLMALAGTMVSNSSLPIQATLKWRWLKFVMWFRNLATAFRAHSTSHQLPDKPWLKHLMPTKLMCGRRIPIPPGRYCRGPKLSWIRSLQSEGISRTSVLAGGTFWRLILVSCS